MPGQLLRGPRSSVRVSREAGSRRVPGRFPVVADCRRGPHGPSFTAGERLRQTREEGAQVPAVGRPEGWPGPAVSSRAAQRPPPSRPRGPGPGLGTELQPHAGAPPGSRPRPSPDGPRRSPRPLLGTSPLWRAPEACCARAQAPLQRTPVRPPAACEPPLHTTRSFDGYQRRRSTPEMPIIVHRTG